MGGLQLRKISPRFPLRSQSPVSPHAGAASPGWGKSGRCRGEHPAQERLTALGTGCEVGVGGTLQVASCRKGTAGLGWEEGGVPLWGQWGGERGTPGDGDTPGRAGEASPRGSRRQRQPCRGHRAAGTEGLWVPGDRAVREGGSAGIPAGSRRWKARRAPHGAEPPCPGAEPRAPGKRPRRSAEHRAPPAPRGQDPLLPGGGWKRRAKKPSGHRFLPSPHASSTSLRLRAAYFQAMLARKVAPVGQPPPALPPSLRSRAHPGPRRAPALRSARVSAEIASLACRPGCSRSASTCSTFCFDLWK